MVSVSVVILCDALCSLGTRLITLTTSCNAQCLLSDASLVSTFSTICTRSCHQ